MAEKLRKAVDMTIAEQARAKAEVKRKADASVRIDALEAKVEALAAENEAFVESFAEMQEENTALKLAVGELRRDLISVREAGERVAKELKSGALQPLNDLKQELTAAQNESRGLAAQVALLQQQLGATPACSRHPHESRWVLVEEEIDEMHSDSSNPQHEAGVVYYVYDLGGFDGKLFSAVWSFRNTRWYSRGGSSGFGISRGVCWAEGEEAAAILWSDERIECTKLRDHRFGRG